MRIGLTYDLRADYLAEGYGEEETAEFDQPVTIEGIESALIALGHQPDRIGHGRQLVNRLAAGDRWDLVFNIAEGLHGMARESQVPAILDMYEIPYTFSDPLVLAVTMHKGIAKSIVRDAGLATPDFAVIERIEDVWHVDLPLPLFAKPVAEGTGKGVNAASKISDRQALPEVCSQLLAKYRQPVLIETFLPGREFTVGIAGTGPEAEVLGSMEVLLLPGAEAEVYSYVNKERCEEFCRYRPGRPEEDDEVRRAESLALACYRALGCRDASRVDVRSDAQGQPNFIEVNPLAGINPVHSDSPILCEMRGISYNTLIERIIASASKRVVGKG
jgi:D-alanine-D-alanine ligase